MMKQAREDLAATRVGSSPEDHARWLIDLAYRYDAAADLSELPSEDVQVVFAELKAFLPDDPARPDDSAPAYLRENYAIRWLKQIRKGVRKLNEGKSWGHTLITHYSFWVPLEGQKQGRYTALGRLRGEAPQAGTLEVTKTLKDAMAHKICETLDSMKASLLRCPRDGCGRLFIRNKRQKYCTPACSARVRIKRYRAKTWP